MIKIFFITFFIAELIIALAIIIKIHEFNRDVNCLNDIISENKYKIKFQMREFKVLMQDFADIIYEFKKILRQKREEYLFQTTKTILMYASILLLKGKYKKTVLAYQFFSEVYEGMIESEI